MIQNQRIIMYKECNTLNEDNLIDFLYNVFYTLILQSSIINVIPKYECKKSKNTKEFIWEKENFKKYVIKNRSSVNNVVVGYCLAFFSDLNEDNSASITLRISCTNKLFSVFDLRLSPNICHAINFNNEYANEIKKLFISLINAFDPFYACIKNDKNTNKMLLCKESLIPNYFHWINYFSLRMYHKLSLCKSSDVSEIELPNGRLMCLSDFPIDVNNNDMLAKQKNIYESMCFKI